MRPRSSGSSVLEMEAWSGSVGEVSVEDSRLSREIWEFIRRRMPTLVPTEHLGDEVDFGGGERGPMRWDGTGIVRSGGAGVDVEDWRGAIIMEE